MYEWVDCECTNGQVVTCPPQQSFTQEVSWPVWWEHCCLEGMFMCHSGKLMAYMLCSNFTYSCRSQEQEMYDGGETVGEFLICNTHIRTLGGYVLLIRWTTWQTVLYMEKINRFVTYSSIPQTLPNTREWKSSPDSYPHALVLDCAFTDLLHTICESYKI